jgi:hypothetical protein
VTIANPETRKRLIINRHIAKMTPEEIARRFLCVRSAEQRQEPRKKQHGKDPLRAGRAVNHVSA